MSKRISTVEPATVYTLRFPQFDREIVTEPGETIYQCARRSGLRIVGACGGRGTCGTCTVQISEGRVQLKDGRVLGPRPAEEGHGPRGRWIRACQVMPSADCTIEVEQRSLAPIVRTDVDLSGRIERLPLDPAVHSVDVVVAGATLADPLSDDDRIVKALDGAETSIDLAAARQLPTVLRDGEWSLRVHRRGRELIGFAPTGSRALGLAIDLGTTNVAGFLVDLENGVPLAGLGIENPQVAWGADVISRINHAIRGPAVASQLREAAVTAIGSLARELCHAVGATTMDIVDATVCGNTAMHHLLLGLPVRQLARAPFVAAMRAATDVKSREFGLSFCPGSYLHVAPNIGGFVGGDHVTALLATEAHWSTATTSIVMDIGTNTEISLIHHGEITTTSCPSGPALEGGHISCGMRAAEGAIEHVAIKNGRISVEVIGNKKPVGLCGSGVLDVVAALREARLVGDTGRLAGDHPDIVDVMGARAAMLAPGVHFSQHDLRAVQLAKSAIRTGVELLLSDAHLVESDIGRVIIAGAFGAYIDVKSGVAIGLLPDIPLDRFKQVGNAAGAGVRLMVASKHARARAGDLAASSRYVELSTRQEFQKTFMRNIGFQTQKTRRTT
jgi:uncharacterized 2Fe-2S/4Fe-4S cluster protein (DUF4445 family)